MKAEEAKNYICPMSLSRNDYHYCKGMECTAWRWSEPKFGAVDKRRGYCGLAGDSRYPLNPDNEKQG